MKRGTAAFTTSIPVEVIIAAGYKPLDLNNIFISSKSPLELVENAEADGFAGSSCAWIKGLYSVLTDGTFNKDLDVFIAVTEGDCSNAKVLEQIATMKTGIKGFIFNYPYDRNLDKMTNEVKRFAQFLGTTESESEKVRIKLNKIRNKLRIIDELSYTMPGLVTGEENHFFLVSSSDFNGNHEAFDKSLDIFMDKLQKRKRTYAFSGLKKIGYLGVPPIVPVHSFFENRKAVVIYNEIQREFAMLDQSDSLAQQYINYSYPYSAFYRFEKAALEIKKRNLDGIIHYVQSFCHRQLEDIILRKVLMDHQINIPLITLEFDKPSAKIDSRVSTRIEAFLETI